MSDYFHIVLFTSLDNKTVRSMMGRLGQADFIFQVVFLGQTEEVMPCYVSEIDPDRILRIGDLTDFDWELESEYGLDSEVLLDAKRTETLVEHVKSYMERHVNSPLVSELWEQLTRAPAGGIVDMA